MQQLFPERQQDVLKHDRLRVRGKNLSVDLIQPRLVESHDSGLDLLLPLRVVGLHKVIGNEVRQSLKRRSLGQDLADLADRHAAFDPVENAANALNIGHRIQTMPTLGARRHNQPIAALPGTQGHRVDAGHA
ncbi:hypothetical protein D3C84_685020 [compost metagenome]